METGKTVNPSSNVDLSNKSEACLLYVPYHIVGLALVDLGLQGLDLELGLLQLADALTGCTLVLVQLTLLLLNEAL